MQGDERKGAPKPLKLPIKWHRPCPTFVFFFHSAVLRLLLLPSPARCVCSFSEGSWRCHCFTMTVFHCERGRTCQCVPLPAWNVSECTNMSYFAKTHMTRAIKCSESTQWKQISIGHSSTNLEWSIRSKYSLNLRFWLYIVVWEQLLTWEILLR